ncbi:MAG: hypothetical protein ACLRZ9_13060 [Eubacterium sp.]
MTKKKYGQKKTRQEVKAYRKFVQEQVPPTGEDFEVISLSTLQGSDDICEDIEDLNKCEPVAKRSLRLTAQDWIKDNWTSVLITAILVPVMAFIIGNIYNLSVKQEVLKESVDRRIEYLEKDISNIKDNYEMKSSLELQISNLKEKISENNYDDINERLTILEQQVIAIEKYK